jgi:hypothetical protein
MIGRGGFYECQNIHSIVIVAPSHISKHLRAFKKLTAYSVSFREPISYSHSNNIHIHLMYPTHNASLLSLIFTFVRLLYIIMSYDHSNFVTEGNELDRSKIRESRNVNISIYWMKIKIMLHGNYL